MLKFPAYVFGFNKLCLAVARYLCKLKIKKGKEKPERLHQPSIVTKY